MSIYLDKLCRHTDFIVYSKHFVFDNHFIVPCDEDHQSGPVRPHQGRAQKNREYPGKYLISLNPERTTEGVR